MGNNRNRNRNRGSKWPLFWHFSQCVCVYLGGQVSNFILHYMREITLFVCLLLQHTVCTVYIINFIELLNWPREMLQKRLGVTNHSLDIDDGLSVGVHCL